MEIDQIIKELENDIRKNSDEHVREIELLQLQTVAKDYQGEDRLVETEKFVESIKNKKGEIRFHSGFTKFDDIVGGFIPKQLIVISAATKSGKTSFCIDLTSRFKDKHPVWIPFEEGAEELIQKFIDRGEEPPHFYAPERMTGNTLSWIEKKIVEGKVKYNSEIIFIDHLHFIVPFTSERQDLAIGQAMRDLKRMAKTWNVVIFLIAHLKKTRVDSQPTLEDLRDSSFIAQEADTVVMLYRQAKKNKQGQVEITNTVNVSVQANRRTGKTGNVQMLYDQGHFLEIAENEVDKFIEDDKIKNW